MSQENESGCVPDNAEFLTVAFLDEQTTLEVLLPELSEKAGKPMKVKIEVISFGDLTGGMPSIVVNEGEEVAEATELAWEEWGNRVISRATIDPVLTTGQVKRLKNDRTILVNAILEINGYAKKTEEAAPQDEPFREHTVSEVDREDSTTSEQDAVGDHSDEVEGRDVQHTGVGAGSEG